MSHEFYVGQKVVCVDDSEPALGKRYVPTWKRGDIFVISEVRSNGLRLVEQVPLWNNKAGIWNFSRFKPLESKSIELFRRIAQGVTDGKPIVPDDLKEPLIVKLFGWPT